MRCDDVGAAEQDRRTGAERLTLRFGHVSSQLHQPITQLYGVRDCGVRDPSSNHLRLCRRVDVTPVSGTLRITLELQRRGPAAAIVLTDEHVALLGSTKTPPVRVTIGGRTIESRVGRMGGENEPTLRAAFDALAQSRRKEHARSVTDAKKPETRQRRIAAVLDALRA